MCHPTHHSGVSLINQWHSVCRWAGKGWWGIPTGHRRPMVCVLARCHSVVSYCSFSSIFAFFVLGSYRPRITFERNAVKAESLYLCHNVESHTSNDVLKRVASHWKADYHVVNISWRCLHSNIDPTMQTWDKVECSMLKNCSCMMRRHSNPYNVSPWVGEQIIIRSVDDAGFFQSLPIFP